MPSRRSVIQSLFAVSAVATMGETAGALADTRSAIPRDFIGLGYEMSSVATAGLLSVENSTYVQLVRNLGVSGVLRVGGIVADFTRYSADDAAVALPMKTVINRVRLKQFRGFLDAVGWTVIWSVNFASGTLDEAIIEAKAVAEVLGLRLNAIELGNEVENYSRGERPWRTPPYEYATYRAEYSRWRSAMLAAVPGLRFAGPDTAASFEWVERMAADAHSDVQLLTTHYYRGDQRKGTQDQLLHTDEELVGRLKRLRDASVRSGIPWRMCETNSFFGGGRPGVSDTLAGALWTLDYMMLLAKSGCAGVNIETGVNQLGFVSSYSPIQDDGAGHNSAGAPYYGMLAFAHAVADAREFVPVGIEFSDESLQVYTLGSGGRVRSVTLINRSSTRDVDFPLEKLGLRNPIELWLRGPSLDSKNGVSFGGEAVGEDGRWAGKAKATKMKGFAVPLGCAVVIRSS